MIPLWRCCIWFALVLLWIFPGGVSAQTTNVAALRAEMNDAMERVRRIVNQPVTRLARQPGMLVHTFSPGWFHEGASHPNFSGADVRATQQLTYEKLGYVTSDLNPGYVFIGSQLEFNSQLKYFYTDRTLPKKRLTQPEMEEINRLYRIIGRCEEQLDEIEHPGVDVEADSSQSGDAASTVVMVRVPIPRSRYILCGSAIVVVLLLYGVYRKWGR